MDGQWMDDRQTDRTAYLALKASEQYYRVSQLAVSTPQHDAEKLCHNKISVRRLSQTCKFCPRDLRQMRKCQQLFYSYLTCQTSALKSRYKYH